MINEKGHLIYSQAVRQDMLDFLPNEYSRVLEVGCNVGNFRQFLSSAVEYWGVEPLKEAADVAKTKMDKTLVGFYDDVANEIPNKHFDLIVANDVVEHMEQPWNFLESIKNKMTTNASIVLSIPNVRHYSNLRGLLYEKDWKYEESGILDITHLRFFTMKSIVRLLEESGFEVEKIEGINQLKIRKRFIRSYCVYELHKLIIGSDIEFMQFGVRAKIKH
jgi:2-polyprenyl-3-methyl-5-hydroxy-6-metoxy-1,4-benzoquinol methylase